ncbi:MAG: response regulator [Candidatus Omnitrophica bacterium]|nr:response regulator [Candidatus Omnitrophota bacterium]
MKFDWKKRKKILVVDDELDTLRNLSRILEMKGYSVMTARYAEEALELSIKNKPDLIILDIILPDISGLQLSERLSEIKHLKNIPIIFITGILSQEEMERMHGAIANKTVISKPCDPNKLLKIIHNKIKETNIS